MVVLIDDSSCGVELGVDKAKVSNTRAGNLLLD